MADLGGATATEGSAPVINVVVVTVVVVTVVVVNVVVVITPTPVAVVVIRTPTEGVELATAAIVGATTAVVHMTKVLFVLPMEKLVIIVGRLTTFKEFVVPLHKMLIMSLPSPLNKMKDCSLVA